MINLTKFFLILSISTLAFGQAVKVTKVGNEMFLSGPDCNLLLKQADAINTWRTNEARPLNKKTCQCAGECKINISAVMPKLAFEKENTELVKNGPNSWNSSLVTAGILPHLRYTQKNEMTFWMNSPLCKERSAGEAAAPGDIIAIRNSNGEEVHGFINISEELSFSKSGFRKGTKYQMANPTEVYQSYGVAKGCEKMYKKPTDLNACPFYANIYRCDSMEDYLKKNPMLDSELKSSWKEIDQLDCQLSGMTFNDTFKGFQTEMLSVTMEAMRILAESKIESDKVSEEDKFLWKAIKFKAISLVEQVGMI